MKKFIFYLATLLAVTVGVLTFGAKQGTVTELYPINGHSFNLTQLTEEGETQELNFVIDENGHFYKEVQNGNYKGDFEAWDGLNFYRFSKANNDLLVIPNEPGAKVISHPFFSEVINAEIIKDLKEETLKKTSLFSQKYNKEFNVGLEKVSETLEFNMDIGHPELYKKEVDKEVTEYIEISELEPTNDKLDIYELFDLDSMKKNGVNINTTSK